MSSRNTYTPGQRARRLVSAALLAWLAACGGALGAAMDRGDKYAQAGQWDKAAAEYEQALRLEPNNPDATIKLEQARAKMSEQRLVRGKSLLQRGEVEAGLAAIQEAVRLDPDSAAAQKALTWANRAALTRAEELLAGPDPKQALDVTTLVLKGSPHDPRAKKVDGQVRDTLAERAYARAEEFATAGKRGNALVEYAAAVTYRPDYGDAKLRIGELKLALNKELTFFVVLEPFAADPRAPTMAIALSPALLAQSFDERLPLRVQEELPRDVDGAVRGVRLTGKFDGYAFDPRRETESRTCEYVCRTEMRPNPDHERAEQAVASAERRVARSEEEAARYQKEVDRYQKEVDDRMKDVMQEEQEADRARTDYERCRDREQKSDSSSSSNPCSSEESRYRSEQSQVESARQRLSSPQSSLASARDQLSRANDSRSSDRRDVERETERMRSTPRTIEVPISCPHQYSVAVHTLSAGVTVRLSLESLHERTKVLDNEPFEYKVQHRDETYAAQPCPEVSRGKRARLPSEKEMRLALVNKTIAGIREKVLGSYDRYRQRFLADARREEAAGLAEEAVEAYVRYVLTDVKSIDPKDEKQIGEFLAKTRGFGKLDQLGSL